MALLNQTSSFLNPGVPGHDDKLKTYEHNVKKAKQVLADETPKIAFSNPTFIICTS